MDYKIEQINSVEELSKMKEFINTNFMPDMPLIVAFGMDKHAPKSSSTSHPTGEPGAIYIKAVDSQGNSIGYAINRVNPKFMPHDDDTEEEMKLMRFMEYFEEEAERRSPKKKMIELRVLSVHNDWRRRGVGRRLTEESLRLAREAGFEAMCAVCTSEYSARLFSSMGWKEYYGLSYKDHPMVLGNEVSLKPNPPHDKLYYLITDL